MMMQIVGAFAEFALEVIRDRTRAGSRAAKDRGIRLGRPRELTPEPEAEAIRKFLDGKHRTRSLAKECGTHVSSIKRTLRRVGAMGPAKLRNGKAGG
ncbi:recombinase family protein [Mitsuaria sp. 7]|uniref:recombinase family protein n=1 Tax=Mitsuaria sp. 7 TaxID=1658665 RepID=UPI00082E86F3